MTPEQREIVKETRKVILQLRDKWNVVAEMGDMNPKLLKVAVDVVEIAILTRAAVGAIIPEAVVAFVEKQRGGTLAKAIAAIEPARRKGSAPGVLFLRDEITLLHDLRGLVTAMDSKNHPALGIIRLSLRVGQLMHMFYSWHSGRTIALIWKSARQSESGRLSRRISDGDLVRAKRLFDEETKKGTSRAKVLVITAAKLAKEGIVISTRNLDRHMPKDGRRDVTFANLRRLLARVQGSDNG